MESLKIWFLCIVSAVVYGVLHDQVTVRVCPEYFTVFHPHLIDTNSLTVLAIAWGIVATWWVGAGLGIPVAICARAGKNPALSARQLALPISLLLVIMGMAALLSGITGYLGNHSYPADSRFYADLSAHKASYFVGGAGGLVLCLWILFKRWRLRRAQLLIDRVPLPAG